MPRQDYLSSDVSDCSPDLNPLSNPLLGKHMGRWAEVYFKSAPGTREAAVLDLLRELEAQELSAQQLPLEDAKRDRQSAAETVRRSEASASRAWFASPGISPASTMIEEATVLCDSCGHENSTFHRFCGECGAPLNTETAQHSSTTASGRDRAEAEVNSNVASVAVSSQRQTAAQESARIDDIRAKLDPQRREFEDSIAHPGELSLFRSFREKDSRDDEDWDETAPRRRFYLIAVLALLIAGAVYMAWRSGQLSAQRSHSEKPAPAAAAQDSGTPGAAPSPQTIGKAASENKQPQATNTDPPAMTGYSRPKPPANSISTSGRHDGAIQRVSNPVAGRISNAVDQQATSQTVVDNGSEELALAERYLNGSSGQRRDSAEAAKWLWKSISKHNGQATVLLADLFLKGDGVSKNCDQARVLLDTAGRKGVAGAGERLRNLRAFGCQ